MSNSKLQTPIQYVKGVGPKLARLFLKLGVRTVEDLFYLLPRAFEDRRQIKPLARIRPADFELVKGEIIRIEHQQTRNRFSILKVYLNDRTATIQAVWFNQPYLLKLFRKGMQLIVSGRVEFSTYDSLLQIQVRDFEIDTGENLKIVPRYSLTEGLYPKKIRAVVKTAIDNYLQYIEQEDIREAIHSLHLPEDPAEIEPARQRLAFEELFIFQLGLLLQRKDYQEESPAKKFTIDPARLENFKRKLPFKLTAAQEKVWAEIAADLKSGRAMNRLLQGDVGSGKTVVAALAAYLGILNGLQVAILAPTEILAQQHYNKLRKLFSPFKIKLELLTASTRTSRNIENALVVGTHALLYEKVKFKNLGLVIIDEQHRFGVSQRARLIEKGNNPHLLVMTATPIPRSLALTIYGDFDRSSIDELPPGRTPVKTYYVPENKRSKANDFIRSKVKEGRQVFVICPLVEENSELDLKAAKEHARRLQKEIFPDLKVGLIHGRVAAEEKGLVMKKFLKGKIDILVSTTVVEVGIDIPNATIMVIEHAERFGLSQLHQLRGRIGRGSEESFCFLIGNPKTETAKERIKTMLATNDGFKIAEADLGLRGPGEFFGLRQSGLPSFRVADIIKDEKFLLPAREKATGFIARDLLGARNCWESQRHKVENPSPGSGGEPDKTFN
jgi:ATP-dependent DNA helicase RecG